MLARLSLAVAREPGRLSKKQRERAARAGLGWAEDPGFAVG